MAYRKKDLRGAFFNVPNGGVDIRIYTKHLVDLETGEVGRSVGPEVEKNHDPEKYEVIVVEQGVFGLTAGVHKATPYAEQALPNAYFEPIGELAAAVTLRGNNRRQDVTTMKAMRVEGEHKTGAKEDWTPPARTAQEVAQMAVERHLKAHLEGEKRREKIKAEKRADKEQREVQLREERRAEREAEAERQEEEARQRKLDAEKAAAAAAEDASAE